MKNEKQTETESRTCQCKKPSCGCETTGACPCGAACDCAEGCRCGETCRCG